MAKQKGGDTLKMAAAAKAKAGAGGDPASPVGAMVPTADVAMSNTGLHIPTELLTRLRIAAARRVARRGYGRPSVSELIVELVERHIGEVEE